MFRKQKCPNCKREYDPARDKCPYCHCQSEFLEDPRLKEFKNTTPLNFIKEIIIFLVGSLGLSVFVFIVEFIAAFFIGFQYGMDGGTRGREASELAEEFFASTDGLALVEFVAYSLLFVTLLFILWKDIKRLLLTFKNKRVFLGFAFGAALMGISMVYNMIIQTAFGNIDTTNANQTAVNSLVSSYPVASLLILGLVGPLCEEITYRVGLFGFLKRIATWFAYVAVALIFGFIHFDFNCLVSGDSTYIAIEFASLPNYIIAGVGLSFVYDRFGFGAAWIAHATNNFVGILVQIIGNNIPE